MDKAGSGDESYLRTAFLERLAHELRGPAGVIHGALQELEAVVSLNTTTPDHEIFLSMAKRGLRRILRTADRLQHTGQLERGTPELSFAATDLTNLVQQAADDAYALEGRKKIVLEYALPSAPLLCAVDAHWLTLAVFELTSNAVRNATQRATVSLMSGEGGGAVISFADDGRANQGFGPSRFLPLREGRGLGLGLAIVYDVVAAHGGALLIENGRPENGASTGARVSVTLPAR